MPACCNDEERDDDSLQSYNDTDLDSEDFSDKDDGEDSGTGRKNE